MSGLLTERYRHRLADVLSCYDRLVVTGTLPGPLRGGMTNFLNAKKIRIFDYAQFAESRLDAILLQRSQLAGAQAECCQHGFHDD